MRSTDINALIIIRALFQTEGGEHVGDLKIKEINPSRLFRLFRLFRLKFSCPP